MLLKKPPTLPKMLPEQLLKERRRSAITQLVLPKMLPENFLKVENGLLPQPGTEQDGFRKRFGMLPKRLEHQLKTRLLAKKIPSPDFSIK